MSLAFSCDPDAHDLLAAENIMNVLFFNIKAEDSFIRELVAVTLCNISTNVNAGAAMSAMGNNIHIDSSSFDG